MLVDLEPQAPLFVIFGELAQLRVFLGICQQVLFQICIMGINFSKVTVFVEVNLSDLLLSSKSYFHKFPCNL